MQTRRKITIVAATFLLAAATGQMMQTVARTGKAAPPRATPAVALASLASLPVPPAPEAGPPLLRPVTFDLTPAPAPAPPGLPAMPDRSPDASAAMAATAAADAGGPAMSAAPVCGPSLALDVGPAAMLHAALAAPCHAGERVVIRHAGLAVTGLVGAGGGLVLDLPAMATDAAVSVRFADGSEVAAAIRVPELSLFDRVAVQWTGDDAFQLHALQFGAAFGSEGDVSAARPGSPADDSGFLTALGDGTVDRPMRAEVYTYPSHFGHTAGTIRIVIESAVTAKTCGRDLLGETLRVTSDQSANQSADQVPETGDLTVSMPACDAVGQIVELPGLLPDLSVAAN